MTSDRELLACVDALQGGQSVHLSDAAAVPFQLEQRSQLVHRESNALVEGMARTGVQRLRIRAAYPYRAHWDEAHMSEDDFRSGTPPVG